MADPVETEIKLVAGPALLAELRSHPLLAGREFAASLTTTYFDTLGARLRRSGAALRIRETGGAREQTLKLHAGSGVGPRRREWTVPAPPEGPPDVDRFPVAPRATLRRLLDGALLKPVAVVRTDRVVRRLRHRGSSIEVAFDSVSIEAGSGSETFCELELELVTGRLGDIIDLALELPLGPELRWSMLAKSDRASALAFDLEPQAAKALPMGFRKAPATAHGFSTIAWNCLEQLLANYPLVIASADPAAVHQSRVAIRRLLCALVLFRGVVADDDAPVFKAEITAVGRELGKIRELMLFAHQAEAAARHMGIDAAALLNHLERRRAAAEAATQALLAGAQFQRLLFNLASWIELGDWRKRGAGPALQESLARFAGDRLVRARRKLLRLGRNLLTLDDRQCHQLRINAKKLRYATEFFSPLFASGPQRKAARESAKHLTRLQDRLGQLNDMAVAATGHPDLFAELEPIEAAGLAAQFGELLAVDRKARRKLLKAANKDLERIAELPRWWRGSGP
jgi:triphosphatase